MQRSVVWEVERPDGRRGILHIELQTKVEPDLGERIAEYLIRLYRLDHLPIRSIVVLLSESGQLPVAPFVIPSDEESEDSQTTQFRVIRLWEIPQERVLGTDHYALWPLASLMADVTVEGTRAVADRIAALPLPAEERQELTGLLAVLAGMRLPIATVLEVLRRSDMLSDLLRESSVAEWLRAEGKAEGMRQMAQVALEGRFGPLALDGAGGATDGRRGRATRGGGARGQ
jgi:hypothetical protein